MSKFEIKGLTFTTLNQTIRFINQLREIGDQLKGSIFHGPMGVKPKYTHFALIVIFKFGQHTKLTSIYPLSIWPWVEAEDIGTTQEGDPGMVQRVHWYNECIKIIRFANDSQCIQLVYP